MRTSGALRKGVAEPEVIETAVIGQKWLPWAGR